MCNKVNERHAVHMILSLSYWLAEPTSNIESMNEIQKKEVLDYNWPALYTFCSVMFKPSFKS